MKLIEEEHRRIRALVRERAIPTTELALSLEDACAQFVATKAEIRSLLLTGELRGVRKFGRLWFPVWRLERAFPRAYSRR